MSGSKRWLAWCGAGFVFLVPWQRATAAFPQASVQVDDAAKGIRLTRDGHFMEAIAYLQRAAQGGGANKSVLRYDLALCYYGAMQYMQAIRELESLRSAGQDNAAVNKLLAQAYVAAGQQPQAHATFARAQAQAPQDEKLYDFVADACSDHGEYALGLAFVDAGLKVLPASARLYYERGLFLAQLDRLGEAVPAFARATLLDPAGDIGVLAAVQGALYRNQSEEALRLVRQAIADGHRDPRMLSLLGSVLLQTGVIPGEPGFAEAQQALEAATAVAPKSADAQLGLGKLYLMKGQTAAAKEHLEAARQMEPGNPSVYASLASVYGRLGRRKERLQCLAILSRLVSERSAAAAVPGP